jgi:dTDP-4-amino-4,6-dideoxygalactose transaminase
LPSSILIPLTDPHAQYVRLRREIDDAIRRVLDSGWLILGPEVDAFESEFAEFIGTRNAIGVANGTDGIALALRGLGIGAGDEVITVSHTAVATVAAIEQAGAVPVLVDVDMETLTLDSSQLDSVLTRRTRAVMPVHLYGRAANLDPIKNFCDQHGLALIEDVSQAHGARWSGRRLGAFGHVGVYSCYPTKNLGALGDAGVIVTSDSALAARLRRLRQYGWQERNTSLEPGINTRLDELQAAILRVKLAHLDAGNDRRAEIAHVYSRDLAGLPVHLPAQATAGEHVYHLFVVQSDDRDALMARLADSGVQSGVHYPRPVHLQPAYAGRVRTAPCMTVTENAAARVLSLPIYPELTDARQRDVVSALHGILA